jgi:serine/threonine protein kinase
MPYETIAEVVLEELGDPPTEVFAEFSETPAASASLGQVHRARLKDGTEVAVKIQYPGVAEALVNDLKNAGLLVGAFRGAGRAMADLDPEPYYQEIRREIGAETDYLREARLNDEFRLAVADVPELHVPRVFPAYSTARVLTMEWVTGRSLRDFASSDATQEERWRVGRQVVLATLVPFVAHDLVHGDPHPGNFLVRDDGRLTVLDFGAVKRFSRGFIDGFWGMMEAELAGAQPDFLALLGGAGFRFTGDADKACKVLLDLHTIAARPVTQEHYDWGNCQIVSDFRRYFTGGYHDVLHVQPPPESLLFYRAIGGMANNLKTLRSAGPYRALCLELSARHRASRARA